MGKLAARLGAGIALALVSAGSALADIAFLPPTSWPASEAQHVVVADLNKDGFGDIAVAEDTPAQASVLLGTGDGGFGARGTMPLAGHPHEIRAANFTGDANVDLAVSEQDTGNVAILPNAGDGTFGAPIDTPAAGNAFALAVGDVNGDTNADLVVGNNASPSIKVLLGNSTGNFFAAGSNSLAAAPTDIAIGDLNNDAKLDLAVTSPSGSNGSMTILLGAGDGTFTPSVTKLAPGATGSVALADFNGDGNLDVSAGIDPQGVGFWDG